MLGRLISALSSHQPQSRLAFERTGDHISGLPKGLYTINADGSDSRQIRDQGKSPRWSPDGKWIAFLEDTEDNGWLPSLFVMRSDGGLSRRLSFHHDVSATAPSWSPDSKRLVYSLWLWQEKKHQIFVIDVATGQVTQLTHSDDNAYPIWTPANEIVFNKTRDPQLSYRLFVMSADGQHQRECALFEDIDSDPVWTYDGRKLVFRRGDRFCLMNADGSGLLDIPTHGRVPMMVISPDARSVAYSSCDDTGEAGFEIFVLRLAEGTEQKLVANPCFKDREVDSHDISWSPYL